MLRGTGGRVRKPWGVISFIPRPQLPHIQELLAGSLWALMAGWWQTLQDWRPYTAAELESYKTFVSGSVGEAAGNLPTSLLGLAMTQVASLFVICLLSIDFTFKGPFCKTVYFWVWLQACQTPTLLGWRPTGLTIPKRPSPCAAERQLSPPAVTVKWSKIKISLEIMES